LLDLLLHVLRSLHDNPLPGHVLQHEPKAVIFPAKACQLVLNEGFDFVLVFLMFILLGFGLSVWVLIV
jgi:hypothetical protein